MERLAKLALVAGSGHPDLAAAVAGELGVPVAAARSQRHPDGERAVEVPAGLRGSDAYLLQPTGPPVDEHLIELLLLADACRRAGAARVSAVVPYFGYARQDRRDAPGEAIGLRVALELLRAARIDRLVVVDPHSRALEAAAGLAVETVGAMPSLGAVLRPLMPPRCVFVAPDLGAARLARSWADEFGAPSAVVRKTRISGEAVRAEEIAGRVAGLAPVIVDDMISTAGTIEAAARIQRANGCEEPPIVVATHAVLVGPAPGILDSLSPRALIVTDSLPVRADLPVPATIASVAGRLADAIGRLHRDEPLAAP